MNTLIMPQTEYININYGRNVFCLKYIANTVGGKKHSAVLGKLQVSFYVFSDGCSTIRHSPHYAA